MPKTTISQNGGGSAPNVIGIKGGRGGSSDGGAGGGGSGHSSGGGAGGGNFVDRALLDSRIETVKAQNETAFARLEAKIDKIEPGATLKQNFILIATAIPVTLGLVVAILAWGSDRFDSGVSAMGAIEDSIDAQSDRNTAQDARIDRILEVLEGQNEQSQTSP